MPIYPEFVSAPYNPIFCSGESITLITSGKKLILPTGSALTLPSLNEFSLTDGRTPMAEGAVTLTNDTNTNTGLHHLLYPWIAVYDPNETEVDFYLFTQRPTNLSYTVDSSGTVTQLVLNPGNGMIYHGRVMHCDLTRDSDSDLIPDVFENSFIGSVNNFLKTFTFPSPLYITTDDNFLVTTDGKTLEAKL